MALTNYIPHGTCCCRSRSGRVRLSQACVCTICPCFRGSLPVCREVDRRASREEAGRLCLCLKPARAAAARLSSRRARASAYESPGVDPSILWLYVLYVSKYIMDKVTTLSRKIYPYLYLHIYRSFIYIFISVSTPIP